MSCYALFYYVVPDFVSARVPYRQEHLELARSAHRRGELMMGGAFADPPDSALLIFRTPDKSVVEQFATSDPYVAHGLVTRWEIRAWTVVVPGDASDQTLEGVSR